MSIKHQSLPFFKKSGSNITTKVSGDGLEVERLTVHGNVNEHKHPLSLLQPIAYDWEARTAGAVSSWRSICWSPELSLFVAVANADTDRVMTSPDGITWTARTAGAVSPWYSICWSPELSLFVAVASSGTDRVMTSPDGITWTSRTAGAVSSWVSICWSPELSLFVAIADDNTMTSSDGITWTATSTIESNSWRSVCWSSKLSLFVAVAYSGTNRVMTSPDGITWTANVASAASTWRSVCWSPELSLFVAVANADTDRVMTSPDGITWTSRTAGAASAWFSICWSSKLSSFAAVANSGTNRVMTSNSIRSLNYMNEISTPTAITNYGVIYPKSDNKLYFQDGAGTEYEISLGSGGSSLVNISLPVESAYLPATNPAALVEVAGSSGYGGWSYLAFDDTTSEHVIWRTPMPDYDGGNIVVTAYTKLASTPPAGRTLQFNILTIGLANSDTFNTASTVDTGVNISQALGPGTLNTDICITTATIDPDNVAADDLMVIELSRDVTSDNLTGDGQLIGIMLEYTRS